MPRKYTKQYFVDQEQIALLRQIVLKCLEPETYYHVLIFALLEVLTTILKSWVADGEIMTRWHGEDG